MGLSLFPVAFKGRIEKEFLLKGSIHQGQVFFLELVFVQGAGKGVGSFEARGKDNDSTGSSVQAVQGAGPEGQRCCDVVSQERTHCFFEALRAVNEDSFIFVDNEEVAVLKEYVGFG